MLWMSLVWAQTLDLGGVVDDDGVPFVYVPFEVPAGTAELQVDHASETDAVLDWGLRGPDGASRGWGGGNEETVWITADNASRSYLAGLPPGTWELVIGKARPIDGPMPYTAEVRLLDTVVSTGMPRASYEPPSMPLEDGPRWYAGDFHVHSRQSGDARASFDEIAALARERGLDFVVITDHNTTSTLDFLMAAQARHPDVLFIPGMEFTTYGGHMNAIGSTVPLDFQGGGEVIDPAIQAIHADGGLVSINHPVLDLGSLCIGCAWTFDVGPGDVDAVEIQTGGLEPFGGFFTNDALAFWEALTTATSLPAAIGGSDDHRAGIDLAFQESPIGSPTTMVRADALSAAAIVAGVRAGRTVVKLQGPEDPMVDWREDDGPLVHVEGEADAVRFIVDGVVQPDVAIAAGIARLDVEPAGQVVRAEAWRGGQRRTVTSHRVLEPVEPEGCGCTTRPTVGWSLGRRR